MSGEELTVCEFQPDDGPAVAKVWSDGLDQTVEASPWMLQPLCRKLMEGLRLSALSKDGDVGPGGANIASHWQQPPDRCMLVAKSTKGVVVGCCGVKLGTEEEKGGGNVVVLPTDGSVASCSVWRVSVLEKERHRGAGTLLMGRAEECGKTMGCHTMYLVTGNPRAGAFYQSLGYAKVGWLESLAPWYRKSL